MAKHGRGLGSEIIEAINCGELIEPISCKKVKKLCEQKGFNYSESYINVILANSTSNSHSPTYKKRFEKVGVGEYIVNSNLN